MSPYPPIVPANNWLPDEVVEPETQTLLHDQTSNALAAIIQVLGPAPAGTYGSVGARLAALDSEGRDFDATQYGVVADGKTDNTAPINALIAKAAEKGGTIWYPPGPIKHDGTIVHRSGVIHRGASPGAVAKTTATTPPGRDVGTRLIHTKRGVGHQFSKVQSFGLYDIGLMYSDEKVGKGDTSAAAPLITIDDNTAFGEFVRFYIGSVDPAKIRSRPALIRFRGALNLKFQTGRLYGANTLVLGLDPTSGSSYANAIGWDNVLFKHYNQAAITNTGRSWAFTGCSFEPASGSPLGGFGRALAYSVDGAGKVQRPARSVSFIDCWAGDTTRASEWFQFAGQGLSIRGGSYSLALGKNVSFIKLLGASSGISVDESTHIFGKQVYKGDKTGGYLINPGRHAWSEADLRALSPNGKAVRGDNWPSTGHIVEKDVQHTFGQVVVHNVFSHTGLRLGTFGAKPAKQPQVAKLPKAPSDAELKKWAVAVDAAARSLGLLGTPPSE